MTAEVLELALVPLQLLSELAVFLLQRLDPSLLLGQVFLRGGAVALQLVVFARQLIDLRAQLPALYGKSLALSRRPVLFLLLRRTDTLLLSREPRFEVLVAVGELLDESLLVLYVLLEALHVIPADLRVRGARPSQLLLLLAEPMLAFKVEVLALQLLEVGLQQLVVLILDRSVLFLLAVEVFEVLYFLLLCLGQLSQLPSVAHQLLLLCLGVPSCCLARFSVGLGSQRLQVRGEDADACFSLLQGFAEGLGLLGGPSELVSQVGFCLLEGLVQPGVLLDGIPLLLVFGKQRRVSAPVVV